jgi:hypothetical protein
VEPQRQKRVLIALGGVVAVGAIVLGVLALTGDDDGSTAGSSTTSSSTSSSTTTSTVATTSTTIPAADLDAALYPDLAAGAVGFDDPVALAKAFSLEILGFDDSALLGTYVGDGVSGAVAVRARAGAEPTVVLVRKLTDGSWAVVGAHASSIRLDTPLDQGLIRSPQPLAGAALAFEGHVNVTLHADGQDVAIATTFVLGGGDAMRAYSGTLTFTAPKGATRGVLVLTAAGGEDGGTLAATAIRVRF